MRIIAFYSPAHGSGKTTAAEAVWEVFRSWEYSFSDPIKNMFHEIFNDWHDSVPKDEPYHEFPFTLRDCFIKIGQSMKELDPDIWIKLFQAKIENEDEHQALCVIDDLRFPNEYDALRDMGAVLVKIVRPELEVVPSETEALLEDKPFDFTIINDGDVEKLKNEAVKVACSTFTQG